MDSHDSDLVRAHLAYLDRMERGCRALAESEPAQAGESATARELNEVRFAQSHRKLLAQRNVSRTAIESQQKTRDGLNRRWFRWLLRNKIKKLDVVINKAMHATAAQQRTLDAAKALYLCDPKEIEAAQRLHDNFTARQKRRDAATANGSRANKLQSQLTDKFRQHGALLEEIMPDIVVDPLNLTHGDMTMVAQYLQHLETALISGLPALVLHTEAKLSATAILDDLRERVRLPTGSANSVFTSRVAASLSVLMAEHHGGDAATLDEQLSKATDPAAFESAEAWLVFWTAVSATLGYSRNCAGSNINENMRAGHWTRAWTQQMERWDDAVMKTLGIQADQLQSAVLELQNSDGETKTGADMMLMILVSLPTGKSYCSVASVQFKRPSGSDKTIDVDNKGWRQFDTLINLEIASAKRINALHALFRNTENGLATIPSVAAATSQSLLGREPLIIGPPEQGKQLSRVSWEENGNALAASLANALCHSASFTSAEEAFDWMKAYNGVHLPDYLVIQSIGGDPMGYAHAIQQGVEFGRSHGYQYERLTEPGPEEPGLDCSRPGM